MSLEEDFEKLSKTVAEMKVSQSFFLKQKDRDAIIETVGEWMKQLSEAVSGLSANLAEFKEEVRAKEEGATELEPQVGTVLTKEVSPDVSALIKRIDELEKKVNAQQVARPVVHTAQVTARPVVDYEKIIRIVKNSMTPNLVLKDYNHNPDQNYLAIWLAVPETNGYNTASLFVSVRHKQGNKPFVNDFDLKYDPTRNDKEYMFTIDLPRNSNPVDFEFYLTDKGSKQALTVLRYQFKESKLYEVRGLSGSPSTDQDRRSIGMEEGSAQQAE